MRKSALLAAALLAAVIPASAQAEAAPARPDYVPDDIWSDARRAEFYERWFGDALHAMGEPVLSNPAGLGNYRRRLRMLVLARRSPSYAVRIDETPAGGRMRIVGLERGAGSAPDRIGRQGRLTVSRDDMGALNDTLHASGLARIAVEAPPRRDPSPDPATGLTTILLCIHPTYYVFELADERGSRFVVRDECDLPDRLRPLIDELREARMDTWLR